MEFGGTLFVFFLVILFPLINLMGIAVSAGIVCLLTHQVATRASTQQTYQAALQGMSSECVDLANSGFANFLKLQRAGGYQNCGCDLYVQATAVGSGATNTFGPNVAVPPPINGAEFVYEYVASTHFIVKPLIPMDGIPFLKSVPALGQPVELTWSADRAAEYIQGLSKAKVAGSGSPVTQLGLDAYAGPPPPPSWNGAPGSQSGWRQPMIYQQIAAAGQTIVGEAVLEVVANNPNWTPTTLTVTNGEKVWIDTQAVGLWRDAPVDPPTDANGWPSMGTAAQVAPGIPSASLIGRLGSAGKPFFLGDFKYNLPPPGSGTFMMIYNDKVGFFSDNTGAQIVRVIVTK